MNTTLLTWALGFITTLILLVLGLYLRFAGLGRSLMAIRTALLGYEGSGGGILHRLGNVETSTATVDTRITDSRHLLRNELATMMVEMEQRIMERIDESDRRVHKEIDELKERRRPS